MDAALYETLLLANPWLEQPDRFLELSSDRVPAEYLERELGARGDWPTVGKANLLVGARQVGKSTLLWQRCRRRGVLPLFVNAEEPAVREWSRLPTRMLADLQGVLLPGMCVFIDEAQHLPEAGLTIKGLVDGGLKAELLVTGSSAFHLRARTRESLAGRAARAVLHPLTLSEVTTSSPAPPTVRAHRIRRTALRHMVVGGYPEVWVSEAQGPVLRSLIEAFVIRDASDFFQIQNLEAFRRLLGLVARQAGSLANYSEWASICEVSRETVSHYLDILEETHIVYRAAPFVGGKRAELTGRPKVFFADTGLRNAIVRQLGPFDDRIDRGPLFESWVGAELRKRLSPLLPDDELRYWRSRSGAEVDFVVNRGDRLLAFEVKACQMKRPQLSRSARSFIQAYAPSVFYVVNLALVASDRIGDTEVRWIPPEVLAEPGLVRA